MDYEIERRSIFEKKAGIIQLSSTHLVWTPDSAADGREVRIAYTAIRGYQVTNATMKKAMIRIECTDRPAPVKFDFGNSFGDRDAIRDVLNKRLTPAGAAQAAAEANAKGSGASSSPAASSVVEKPKPLVDWSSLTAEERKWRELLLHNKDVFSFYRKVVESRVIDDETFWKGMKCKYKSNGQRRGTNVADTHDIVNVGVAKGVPSAAFGPSPADGAGAEVASIAWAGEVPNAAERHRIFMQYPAVGIAYRAKVLQGKAGEAKMTDASFWAVYLKTSMAQRHLKGSKRSAAVATEADAMFAQYHASEAALRKAEEDARASAVDRTLNFRRFDEHRQVHVLQGHISDGGASGRRIGSGGERASRGSGAVSIADSRGLDLMRQLNQHGTMVMDGVASEAKDAWHEDMEERTHPLRDLEDVPEAEYTKLAVESEIALFEPRSGVRPESGRESQTLGVGSFASGQQGRDNDGSAVERGDVIHDLIPSAYAEGMSAMLKLWEPNLARLEGGGEMASRTLEELLVSMRP